MIANLTASSMTDATVLAGANLGSDGRLGGTGSAADSFAAGTIDALDVTGAISSSFIARGVAPFNGTFGSGNDTSAGVGLIKSIHARRPTAQPGSSPVRSASRICRGGWTSPRIRDSSFFNSESAGTPADQLTVNPA